MLQKTERGGLFRAPRRPLRPGISLVVPAYDEELVIVPTVRSLLAADYEPLEVVVSDDGSKDETLAVLTEAFDLRELPLGDRFGLETEPLEALYVSAADPRLRVAANATAAARTRSTRASTTRATSSWGSWTRTRCWTATPSRASSRSSPPIPTASSPWAEQSGSQTAVR